MERIIAVAVVAFAASAQAASLAALAQRYGTDKSRSNGHNYVSLYAMLLDPLRESVRNVTEVGVWSGSSVLMWADYFGNAQIFGLDIASLTTAKERTRQYGARVHLHTASSQDPDVPRQLHLANESMDLVIDDGDHSWEGNHRTAEVFWPLVRPGGLYVIEDVATGGDHRGKYGSKRHDPPGYATVAHNATGALRKIFESNEVFMADTLVGLDFTHNAYIKWELKQHWAHDRANHNGHLVVIRKRRRAEGSAGRGEESDPHPTSTNSEQLDISNRTGPGGLRVGRHGAHA